VEIVGAEGSELLDLSPGMLALVHSPDDIEHFVLGESVESDRVVIAGDQETATDLAALIGADVQPLGADLWTLEAPDVLHELATVDETPPGLEEVIPLVNDPDPLPGDGSVGEDRTARRAWVLAPSATGRRASAATDALDRSDAFRTAAVAGPRGLLDGLDFAGRSAMSAALVGLWDADDDTAPCLLLDAAGRFAWCDEQGVPGGPAGRFELADGGVALLRPSGTTVVIGVALDRLSDGDSTWRPAPSASGRPTSRRWCSPRTRAPPPPPFPTPTPTECASPPCSSPSCASSA
jgi:hypothetical protein